MYLGKMISTVRGNVICGFPRRTWIKRHFTIGVVQTQQVLKDYPESNETCRTDEEWLNAKENKEIPGPSAIGAYLEFLPGGKLHKVDLLNFHKIMRGTYGDIYCIRGLFGKPDIVFTYNADDFESVYRNEGIWPIRGGMPTFTYYRQVKRPDVFQGIGGLVSDQGKAWADVRNKVNPVLMKPQNVLRTLPELNKIANEFLDKLDTHIDPRTRTLNVNFLDELKMWSFESISYFALNTRMGLMTDNPDPNARKLADVMTDFFQYSYEYDMMPSYWKYIETPGFKRLIRTYDKMTEISSNYVDEAIRRIDSENNVEAKSALEQLCRIDRKVAVIMAMDMLMAGMDTTSSTTINTLYQLARNPEKQEILRRELKASLPDQESPLTEESLKQMPYLRACIKEALRITPISPGNFRMAGRDIVLSGYQVPKGTGVLMGFMYLANSDEYFPRSSEFLPERWIKTGESSCPAAKGLHPFVYLPFGFGPRTCIGKRLAQLEMETVISKLIRRYQVSWNREEGMKYVSNIILMPERNLDFKFEQITEKD